MKHGIKFLLCMIGVGLLILGTMTAGFGWYLCGDPQAVLEAISIEGIWFTGGKQLDSEVRADGIYAVSETVTGLYLDWTAGTVTISTYDGDKIRFAEQSDAPLTEENGLRWELERGILTIQYCQPQVRQNLPIKDLEIQIPEDLALDLLTADLTSADLTGKDIRAQNVQISGTSGTVDLSGMACADSVLGTNSGEIRFAGQVQRLYADSTSGDITILQSGEAAEVQASANSGTICLSGSYTAVAAETTSGDISTDGAFFAAECKLHTNSGSVNMTGSLQNITADTTSGDVTLTSDAEPMAIVVDTTSGEVSLCLPEDGGFALVYDSSSGAMECELPLRLLGEEAYLCGDGTGEITVSTTSGDLKITAMP